MEKSVILKKEEYDILLESIKQTVEDMSNIQLSISAKRKELRQLGSKLNTLRIKAKNLRQP